MVTVIVIISITLYVIENENISCDYDDSKTNKFSPNDKRNGKINTGIDWMVLSDQAIIGCCVSISGGG